ncbi:MAG: hypothetical protein EBT15_10000 [Betaproteobacteria bacterium]|nr:hypothetical protein [Betaproteobacteria bacterium]
MSGYEMPKAELGDWVLYFVHEGATPVPALVSQVSSRTLTLWAICPGYGGAEKPSVHHVTDPGVAEFPAWKSYGFWEHRPAGQLAMLSERVSLLERKLDERGNKK